MDSAGNIPLDANIGGASARAAQLVARALMGMSRQNTKDQVGQLLALEGSPAVQIAQALLAPRAAIEGNAATLSRAASSPQWIGLTSPSHRQSSGDR
ncbi:hypothetical protein QBC99_003574 [Beijerinckia sp. GAS462]|uniref:hypothetical protein n=1 Tax=Beijerinckia sp. GAS462 TaxID=3039852 RepID=UPI00089747DD|nr:hypothetical protein [Beijerinckia sp. GAS462]MDH7797511.1 hypothetical protein [Beijerinckia sp. GAS462]SEC88498.1 hypothetical protein SAMN05443249_3805 [Beijerinckia sp. 28-YEA-48]